MALNTESSAYIPRPCFLKLCWLKSVFCINTYVSLPIIVICVVYTHLCWHSSLFLNIFCIVWSINPSTISQTIWMSYCLFLVVNTWRNKLSHSTSYFIFVFLNVHVKWNIMCQTVRNVKTHFSCCAANSVYRYWYQSCYQGNELFLLLYCAESVKPLQCYCSCLPVSVMLRMRKLLFWKQMLCSGNVVLCLLAKCCKESFFALAD